MPSTLPGSFASAAAGNNSDSSSRTPREGQGFGEWQRRVNGGATQTFRRSSTATTQSSQAQQRESAPVSQTTNASSVATYVPPHMNANRSSTALETRYSRSQLLDLYRDQKDAGELGRGLDALFVGDWVDGQHDGDTSTKWSRRDELKHSSQPASDVCWDRSGAIEPLGLVDMTEEEKEIFSTSVNSPLKGPQQSGPRDGSARDGPVGRKSSVSHNSNSAMYGLSSPVVGRPQNRRREPSESYPFPLSSPSASAAREEGQDFGFARRRTELQEEEAGRNHGDADREIASGSNRSNDNPYGSIRRASTNPVGSALPGPSSPWSSGPSNQGLSNIGGAFGNFGLGVTSAAPPPSASTGRPGMAPSRESRFRSLMTKASVDEESQTGSDVPGLRGLGTLEESSAHDPSGRPISGETDPFSREGLVQDSSRAFGTPPRRQTNDESGFPSQSQRGYATQDDSYDPSNRAFRGDQFQDHSHEPMSPTYTNPYSSPQQRLASMRDDASEDSGTGNVHLHGLGNVNREPFASRRDQERLTSYQQELGQTSRGFPSLPGLGGLPGLGNSDPWSNRSRTGTPTRERPFGDVGDYGMRPAGAFQSPSLAGIPGAGLGGIGPGNRGGRMGSFIPNAAPDQSRNEQGSWQTEEQGKYPEGLEMRGEANSRDMDSPFQGGRGKFDDFLGDGEKSQGRPGQAFVDEQSAQNLSAAPAHSLSHQPSIQQYSSSQHSASSSSNQPPPAQQKTMVMPDRIRWIYRDPQGVVQGPWSGLEMHDWYRAGFFSPELLVKKLEDAEYEPLAQLIRRIGNSREPFLVPQIGIPHPTSNQGVGQWPAQNTLQSPVSTTSSAQPPFAGSFPSFGTTLTADQQNALERRKQEEQYLMARQKEHLAHQQVMVRQQMQNQGLHVQGLQHHSSAQSLNSQPSYGSMTAPNGYQASPAQALNPMSQVDGGGFDNFRLGRGGIGPIGSGLENLGQIREEDPSLLSRPQEGNALDIVGRQKFHDAPHDARAAQMLADRSRLQQEQAQADLHQQNFGETELGGDRLREFHDLQNQRMTESFDQKDLGFSSLEQVQPENRRQGRRDESQRNLSLTEQVQQAATAKQAPSASAWAKPEAVPPQSNSPLPAPAARRGGPSLAESLAAETLPPPQSPSVETPTAAPSLAPWAREQQEGTQKQPSLKEIQEAEARRAAKQEQTAAAARRAALEREAANQPPPPAPGLPSTSTWASNESPLVPTAPTNLAWAKSAAAKNQPLPAGVKKTLQQIQQEEEAAARKKRAQAGSAGTMAGAISGSAQAVGGAKRYADLAGKAATAVTPSPPASGAWTTVGASGKVKGTPTSAAPALATRTASSSSIPPPTVQAKKVAPPVGVKTSLASAQQTAQEEFKKWAIGELRNDLNKGISVDDFVNTLIDFPPDTDMLTEVVHASSNTVDSRHFAEEFVRRRGLADKGKVESSSIGGGVHSTVEPKMGNGWSEVARKGGAASAQPKDDGATGAFKIVAAKKKGGKK